MRPLKKIILYIILIAFLKAPVFSQTTFSAETQKYIEYNDSITVFKNVLLIDGKGNDAKPHQTVIINKGK